MGLESCVRRDQYNGVMTRRVFLWLAVASLAGLALTNVGIAFAAGDANVMPGSAPLQFRTARRRS